MYRSLDSAGLVQGYEIKIVQIVFHALIWSTDSMSMTQLLHVQAFEKMCDLTVESYFICIIYVYSIP